MTRGGARSSGETPRRVTGLQPEDQAGRGANKPTPAQDNLRSAGHVEETAHEEQVDSESEGTIEVAAGMLAELGRAEAELEFDTEEQADSDAAHRGARHLRQEQDHLLYTQLSAAGFQGPKYKIFRNELAAYALPVIRAWLRRGLIFAHTLDQGRPLTVTDYDRAGLQDVDERVGLAGETVAKALVLFHRKAIAGTGWTPAGGAALTTYFVGACVSVFPNIYRRWQRHRERWRPSFCAADEDIRDLTRAKGEDHAAEVISRQWIKERLMNKSAELREMAFQLAWEDKTFSEIAAEHGITTRAVEGRLYRERTKFQRREEG